MCGDGSGAAGKASTHLGSGRHIGAEGQLGAEGQTQARASTGKASTIPTRGRQLRPEGRQLHMGAECQTQRSLSWKRVTHQDAIAGTAPVTAVLVPAPRPPALKGPMLHPPDDDAESGFPKTVEHADKKTHV